jgi:hypothetical protein
VDIALRRQRQPLRRDRGPAHVPAEPFELPTRVGLDADTGVPLESAADALGNLLQERLQLPLRGRSDAAKHRRHRVGEKAAVEHQHVKMNVEQ